MAEAAALAVASPILKLVIGKLGSGFWEELGFVWGVHSDIERLQSVLSTISDVLDDAERISIDDKALTGWLRKLKDAAFDADDVVDEFQHEAQRRRMQRGNQLTGKVSDFFSPNNQIAFRRKMARKIKKINKRLGEIADERSKFHLAEGSTSRRTLDRETFSAVDETEVYGRDEDKEQIINFLVSADDSSHVSVLPIVGLGGVGKTTLAQLACNDQRIKDHFDLVIWVCVSDDFSILRIINKIIEIINEITKCGKDHFDLSSLEAAQLHLEDKLSGRKFLLVLDDVWNEDEAKWERLKTLLRGGKILTTTRTDVVARIMGTMATHKLQGLTFADCWTLFKHRAFGPGGEEETPRLVQIGKEIVEKCKGLPLAVKALGGLMRFKTDEAEWLHVRDSEIWRLPENNILPALQLSYNHLPSDLKQCFAYCSIFPKDYNIEREKLIQLWIAEGFIQTVDGDMDEEYIGNRYFNMLLWRSFFQDTKNDFYGDIRICKMHDLMHDLACSITKDESSIMQVGTNKSIPHGCRYLSIHYDHTMSSTTLKGAFEAKKLRSLILLGQYSPPRMDIQEFVIYAMSSLTHLRALDLSGVDIKEVPCTISKLKHLRLLDLSCTKIEALPGSITDLHNLRTLNLTYCWYLKSLPDGMIHMSSLRHLNVSSCNKLICMPRWLGRLSNLRTMSKFVVEKEDGRTISELEHLNLISGYLKITNLNNVQDPLEATKANLASKTNLQSLVLEWKGDSYMESAASSVSEVEEVFERLQPHFNLKELFVFYYPGIQYPTWMTRMELASSPIRNLIMIKLSRLERCKCLPALGHLPFLERIQICQMSAVRRIGVEFCGDGGTFPSLQALHISGLRNLEEWSPEVTAAEKSVMVFPRLQTFSVMGCPKLGVALHVPPSVVRLSIDDDRVLSAVTTRGSCKLKSLYFQHCAALSLPSSRWEWMQDLTVLTYLCINDADLTYLCEGILQLRMPSLQKVELLCDNMESISGEERDRQQQPPTLFMTIQDLYMDSCRKLTALPDWLGSLTELQRLRIFDCSQLLGRRYERERGEDWPKIAHIPSIHIQPAIVREEDIEENSKRFRRIISF